MYVSWTKITVFLRIILGYIWDLSDVFTMHSCSARAQMQYLKSSLIVHFGVMILKIGFIKIIRKQQRKFNKISTVNLQDVQEHIYQ